MHSTLGKYSWYSVWLGLSSLLLPHTATATDKPLFVSSPSASTDEQPQHTRLGHSIDVRKIEIKNEVAQKTRESDIKEFKKIFTSPKKGWRRTLYTYRSHSFFFPMIKDPEGRSFLQSLYKHSPNRLCLLLLGEENQIPKDHLIILRHLNIPYKGESLLYQAIKSSSPSLIKSLILHPAINLQQKTNTGETLLDCFNANKNSLKKVASTEDYDLIKNILEDKEDPIIEERAQYTTFKLLLRDPFIITLRKTLGFLIACRVVVSLFRVAIKTLKKHKTSKTL